MIRLVIVLLGAAVGATTPALEPASPMSENVGTWRGPSRCTDRVAAPGCTDEHVIDDITATPGKANTVSVKADKYSRA